MVKIKTGIDQAGEIWDGSNYEEQLALHNEMKKSPRKKEWPHFLDSSYGMVGRPFNSFRPTTQYALFRISLRLGEIKEE